MKWLYMSKTQKQMMVALLMMVLTGGPTMSRQYLAQRPELLVDITTGHSPHPPLLHLPHDRASSRQVLRAVRGHARTIAEPRPPQIRK